METLETPAPGTAAGHVAVMLRSRAVPRRWWAREVLGCAAQQQGLVGSSCAQLLPPST